MPSFNAGGGDTTPFGRNEFLRSTRGRLTESYTVAASTVPAKTIDGNGGQKILQPGTVMALITSGGETGKIGPYVLGVTDGRQTAANIVGLNETFLPWQLIERDVEVSVLYGGSAWQAWCIEYTDGATGASQALSDATVTAMQIQRLKNLVFSK